MKLCKIPTGIKTFDVNINGGFPVGSVILLLEDVGAGAREFVYTSIFNISKEKVERGNIGPIKISNSNNGNDGEIATFHIFPDKICYVSLSRSKEDILNENAYSFRKGFGDAIRDGLIFKDLSSVYFRDSIVQELWLSGNKEIAGANRDPGKTILEEMSLFLKAHAENNIVIVDSLTDLMMNNVDHLDKDDVLMFLKGMVRIAKTWNGLTYVILGTDILENHVQKLVTEIVDGVLVFEWYNSGSVKMQRNLYISKFRGLMPQLEQNKIAKFEIKITSDNGLEVSNVRKII